MKKRYILVLLKQLHEMFRSKTPRFRKIDNSSEKYALMHREGLNGLI